MVNKPNKKINRSMRNSKKAGSIAVTVVIICLMVLAWRNDKKTDEINTIISIVAFVAIVKAIWMKLVSDKDKNKEKKQKENIVQNK